MTILIQGGPGEFEQFAKQTRGLQANVKVIETAYDDYCGSKGDHR